MPQFDDVDAAWFEYHVPGVYAAVLVEQRKRIVAEASVYVDDPRELLWLGTDEHAALGDRAARDAEEWFTRAIRGREPVTASYAAMRGAVAKDSPVLTDNRDASEFTVHPDDTIEVRG